MKVTTIKFDNLFHISFPYSAALNQNIANETSECWNWHMHSYLSLLHWAIVKTFMVRYEMMAEPQRYITAEQSADILRNITEQHYKLH